MIYSDDYMNGHKETLRTPTPAILTWSLGSSPASTRVASRGNHPATSGCKGSCSKCLSFAWTEPRGPSVLCFPSFGIVRDSLLFHGAEVRSFSVHCCTMITCVSHGTMACHSCHPTFCKVIPHHIVSGHTMLCHPCEKE